MTIQPKSRSPIVLNQVGKCYETSSGPFAALKNVNLEIRQGEFVAVLKLFYRLEESRNRESGGTGLGLAIAQ